MANEKKPRKKTKEKDSVEKENLEETKKDLDKKEDFEKENLEETKKDLDKKSEKDNENLTPDQNKVLRNFLIIILGVIVLVFIIYFITNMEKEIEYKGIQFQEYQKGDILFYYTYFPLYNTEGVHVKNYNLYLRKNPVQTGKIEFNGNLELKRNLVINFEEDLNMDLKCTEKKKGDDVIAIANLANLLHASGINVVKNETLSCDPEKRYVFLNLKPGEKTRIEKTQESCYDIYIKECEILSATERFILETLLELQKRETL